MDEIKDFESFYTSKLQPFLADLNARGNDATKWAVAGIAAIVLAIVCFVIEQLPTGLILIIAAVLSAYKYSVKQHELTFSYKETVIREIITYLNPGAEYQPSKKISSNDYKKSGLFTHIFNYYGGEDFIKGVYKNVTFYSSELNTGYKPRGEEGHEISIFHGLFFAAPINAAFTGNTYIWPRDDKQFPQSLADEYFERFMPLPKLYRIKTKNHNFEKFFCMYSTNPPETNLVMDAQMIERMVHFKKQINRDMRFSFVDGICYVAVTIDEDLLEPSISDPGNKENIKEYFFSVLLVLSIINQLNLSRLM